MLQTFNQTANGSTIESKVKDFCAVELAENQSTGFSWQIMPVEHIAIMSSEYMPSEQAKNGGGGMRVIKFQAITPGNATLTLLLRQPWLSLEEVGEKFELQFVVS